jgi:hypothetical protein
MKISPNMVRGLKIIQTYTRVLTIVEQGLVQKVAHETLENALQAHGI